MINILNSKHKETLGTLANPLIVVDLESRKEEFLKKIKNHKGGDCGYLFKDQNKHSYDIDYFGLNLVTHPELSKSDIAIGLYLHKKLVMTRHTDMGLGFWTGKSSQNDWKFGCGKKFYIFKKGYTFDIPKPFVDLQKDLEKHNIYLQLETIIKALRKLHLNLFISMTTKHGITKDPADPRVRSEFRYIEVYQQMVIKPIYKDWAK